MGLLDYILENHLEHVGGFHHQHWLLQPDVVNRCPVCQKLMASGLTYDQHWQAEHPYKLPTLWLEGRPISSEMAFDVLPDSQVWHAKDTHEILLSWRNGDAAVRCRPDEIGAHLVAGKGQVTTVRLLGHRSELVREYQLVDYSSLDRNTIGRIHSAYAEAVSTFIREADRPRALEDFGRFTVPQNLPLRALERNYLDGLYLYLQGLLDKDKAPVSNVSVGLDRFRSALHALKLFRTPLAVALREVICLNLNLIEGDTLGRSHNRRLARAAAFFTGKSRPGVRARTSVPADANYFQVPVDRLTDDILRLATDLMANAPRHAAVLSQAEILLERRDISHHDRQKLVILRHHADAVVRGERPSSDVLEDAVAKGFQGWAQRWREQQDD